MGDIYLWTLPPIFLPHLFTLIHSPSCSVSLSPSCNLFAPLIFFKGTKIFSLPLIFFPLTHQSSPWQPNPVWNLLLKQTFYPPVPASTIPNQMSTSSVWLTSAKLETQSDYPNPMKACGPPLISNFLRVQVSPLPLIHRTYIPRPPRGCLKPQIVLNPLCFFLYIPTYDKVWFIN